MAVLTDELGRVYGKPNLAALDGELGRLVYEEITTAPSPDWTALEEECARVEARIREAMANGTY